RAQVQREDVGAGIRLQAHDDALAIGRKARGKRHAGKVADRLALLRLDVHQVDLRLRGAGIGHVGDFLAGRREARRQLDGGAARAGAGRGARSMSVPRVRSRTLAPSWSMIASRLTRLSFGPLSSTKTTRVSK